MNINVPELSLVILIGASGSGKSTFAKKFFKPTEIVSSDTCRGIVSDNENDQSATPDAFELLHFIISKRLKNGLLTVVDATHVQPEARKSLIQLAKKYHCLPVAIVLNMSEKVCAERNKTRTDRHLAAHVIPQQISQLRKSLKFLKKEGFRHIHEFRSPTELEQVQSILREQLYNNKKHESGPFDIIGDIHGCYDELLLLLEKLGYVITRGPESDSDLGVTVEAPNGRRVIFLGDLVDRGPKTPDVLKLVMAMVAQGIAFCVPGNHDIKLLKYLQGDSVQVKHGLQQSIDQLSMESPLFIQKVKQFIDGLVSHYVFDAGKLVVAHAGLKEEMHGRGSGAVRSFCLYGETTGEVDEFGLPVRLNWASEYKGRAMVVYGHTPVPEAQWLNNTIDVDTGCVFGGKLTALRYPEKEIISVKAHETYCIPARPLGYAEFTNGSSLQQEYDDVLDIGDISGKLIIPTRYGHQITIREENAMAALEVMSRFALHPKWLIYLPPTMSPSETSDKEDFLEHPQEAFEYYIKNGVDKVVCEEKHMGSRVVLVVCKDTQTVKQRFGIDEDCLGVCYTRTGRNFFTDKDMELSFISEVQKALTLADFWKEFDSDWVCLDAELMPWSAKAQALLRDQYAAVATASTNALQEVKNVLLQAIVSGPEVTTLLNDYSERLDVAEKYTKSYQQYCWPVQSVNDYKLAPFHILATEHHTHFDKDHVWHMEHIRKIALHAPHLFRSTPYKEVLLTDPVQRQEACDWWLNLTNKGGEGMVVKPFHFISENAKGLIQPAVKIRGREYLRIIYGPEYTLPANISRLRKRGLNAKRSLALREFSLGVEALERFVKKEPLRQVHRCVFGILALESEPVDPRL
ncbi:MAG: polynucleotide kinase-phosphatase [Cytophagaceae bacterium]|jgi:polynucleotide kinase-phosphatase|nr:polynucleotide kinase-phosphatase [Cytophagaceae bacterium]